MLGRDEMLRVRLLLAERLVESSNTTDDTNGHEAEGNGRPDDAPALGGPAVLACKNAGIRSVDLPKDQIIALFEL